MQLLCERGWEASQALATSWRQTYTRAESSPAGQAAAEAAFKQHCSGVSAETLDRQHDALALSLSRPASWPLPLAASDIAADSGVASWAASSAVMTHLLHQLTALEAVLSDPQQQSHLSDHSAASLPAPWLQLRLRGAEESISGAALVERLGGAGACQAAASQGVLLIQVAAGCLYERISVQSVELGIFWLQQVSQRVNIYQHLHSIGITNKCICQRRVTPKFLHQYSSSGYQLLTAPDYVQAKAAQGGGLEACVAAEQALQVLSQIRVHPAFEHAKAQWLQQVSF